MKFRISAGLIAFYWLAAAQSVQAATLVSSGFTGSGTYEAVYTENILAGSSGDATVYAPVGFGWMGWSLSGTGGTVLTDPLSSGFLAETDTSVRGYSHSGASDGLLELTVAWADTAWVGLTSAEILAVLDPGVTTSLFESSCTVDCSSTGGGSGGGDPDVSAVPLPAAGWLLLAGIGGLGALRRKAT